MHPIFDLFDEYIGNNRVEEAINLMLEFLRHRDQDLYDDFLRTKNQFKRYYKEYTSGLTNDRTEHSRIVKSLQLSMREVRERDFPELIEQQREDHTDIIAALYTNVHATITADLPLIEHTTHPENPIYAENIQTHRELFLHYPKLEYRIMDLTVEQHEENFAVVRVTQQTIGTDWYPAFRDNQVIMLHTLKQDQDVWKIYGTTVSEVKYLG